MINLYTKERDFVPYTIVDNTVVLRINIREKNGIVFYSELKTKIVNKNVLIDTLITANYPSDKMDAVRNNYDLVRDGVAGDKTEEYTKEYLDMQAWRKKAKELADEIMKEYNKEK